jgi:hypothetical protein
MTHFQQWLSAHWFRLLACGVLTTLVLVSADHAFFWDTIQLGAKHGLFYYESGFSQLLLPDRIDSGHIPVFGMYLAVVWMLFGKSLIASHLAMLPFVLGIVWQSDRLIARYIDRRYLPLMLPLFLCDPTLLSQIALVSPDIPLVFFFLLALNATLTNKRALLALAVLGLFLTSMRGMMVSVAILAIDIYSNLERKDKKWLSILRQGLPYLPAVLLFCLFSVYHYTEKGWIGFHSGSPWAPAFEGVSARSLLWNAGIFAWRLVDFGRVFVWLLVFAIAIMQWEAVRKDRVVRDVAFIFVVSALSLSVTIGFGNLLGHRYYLPLYMTFTLLAITLLVRHVQHTLIRTTLTLLTIAMLLTGNLWVYPDKIAQGWDSTLAHLPYYEMRSQVIAYLEKEGIPINNVGTAFPLLAPFKYQDLADSQVAFAEKDLATQGYILYTNVSNDFTDTEIDALESSWQLIMEWSSATVDFRLYALVADR